MKKNIFIFFVFLTSFALSQTNTEKKLETKADFRFTYQADFKANNSEFILKNARFFAESKNYENISFRVMADFSPILNFNSIKDTILGRQFVRDVSLNYQNVLLEASIDAQIFKNYNLRLGQQKPPFAIENFLRSPMQVTFSNRTILLNKVYPALYDIGIYFIGKNFLGLPLNFYAGAFNGEGLNKRQSDKTINFTSRAEFLFDKKNMISGDFYFGKLNKEDVYIGNFGADLTFDKLNIVFEAANRHSINAVKEYNSYGAYLDLRYDFEIENNKLFSIRKLSPAARAEYLEPDDLVKDDEYGKGTLGIKTFHNESKNLEISAFFEYYAYKSSAAKNYSVLLLEARYWFY